MAIREDVVASAAQFLQDTSVASSSMDNKISFLRTKNLTREEIDAALARAATGSTPGPAYQTAPPPPQLQPYPQPYSQYAWQQQFQPPRRDWRDWFIMATVVSGAAYSLYTLGKRYVFPLVAPPTPERLEQDKKTIEEQFDRAFALVEQLAKDTEALKAAEAQRAERLDDALSGLETTLSDLKAGNRRHEDDGIRIRDEIQGLKAALPKAMDSQKALTDKRLVEISAELDSLKTLINQRMSGGSAAAAASRPSWLDNGMGGSDALQTTTTAGEGSSGAALNNGGGGGSSNSNSAAKRASIPAWQMAAASAAAPATKTKTATSAMGNINEVQNGEKSEPGPEPEPKAEAEAEAGSSRAS